MCFVRNLPLGQGELRVIPHLAGSMSALTRRWESNDHCEQFDHCESNHQHRDRYRIVIEPMPLLCIHDTPPCSSNFNDIRTHVGPHRCGSLFLRFELLDERSDMRGDGRRESVVLDPEVVPNRQPNASIGSGNQLALTSTICPRSASGMGYRAEISWGKIGCVDTPTNPVIDAVGCSSHGHGAPSLRVEGRPRQADHRLPLELTCYSEELNSLAQQA